eukprot:TRINITY_DN74492_c0_g1_i1.p1 TRINITY_DN74492_c0_g1~~TRINITY_DN74492_c0_g1_i1.p1  ORF type:complete len:1190 (-),score=146.10 TRINITY_DN74492_c0_g1_i1:329-3898(-)
MHHVGTLIGILNQLTNMMDHIGDSIVDNAPTVIDLFGTSSEFCALRFNIVYAEVPEPVFPNFDDMSDDMIRARRVYYLSLSLEASLFFIVFGICITALRNVIRRYLDNPRQTGERDVAAYQRLGSSALIDGARRKGNTLQFFLAKPIVLLAIVFSQIVVLSSVAARCYTRGTMSDHLGVGFEFWMLFGTMHFTGGLVETILSVFKPGQISLSTYPRKLILTGMPLISEKVDTAKDIVLTVVALSHDQAWCAGLYFGVLVCSQMFFITNQAVRAELVEAYTPMMTAPVTYGWAQGGTHALEEQAQDTSAQIHSWTNQIHAIPARLRSAVAGLCGVVRVEFELQVLKQSTEARRIISLCEDLPQALLSVYLATFSHSASWFCLVTVGMSVIRLVLASYRVSRWIRRRYTPGVHMRRFLAVQSGNKDMALDLTKQLWEVYGEDLSKLTYEGDDTLVESLAAMAETDDEGLFTTSTMTTPDCGVFLVLVALGENRSDFVRRLEELREHMSGGRTLMHVAAWTGNKDCLAKLKEVGGDLSVRGAAGETVMHYASKYGNEECIRWLALSGCDVNEEDPKGRTPVHYATSGGHEHCFQTLKDLGADMNRPDNNKMTPMQAAAMDGLPSCVEKLVVCGVDPNQHDTDGKRVIHLAAWHGQDKCVAKLQELRVDINLADDHGKTALHYAARGDRPACIEVLTVLGADLHKNDTYGWSPILDAAVAGNDKCVQRLADLKADANRPNKDGRTPMRLAAKGGHADCFQLLKNAGGEINKVAPAGWMAILDALLAGHTACVETLNTLGADIEIADKDGRTPAHHAAVSGDVTCLRLLRDLGADFSKEDVKGYTPVFLAVCGGHWPPHECILMLKELGIDLNQKNTHGKALVHTLAEYVDDDCMEKGSWLVLKDFGADLSLKDGAGKSALHIAEDHGRDDLIVYLLNCGFPSDVQDAKGETIIHKVFYKQKFGLVTVLAGLGVSCHVKDNLGETLMHKAARNGDDGFMTTLMSLGVNASDEEHGGRTPMHVAAQADKPRCIALLLGLGAGRDCSAKDQHGRTPVHYAAAAGASDCIKILVELCADVNATDYEGATPVHMLAASCYHEEKSEGCLSVLTASRANINVQDLSGDAPIHVAARSANVNVVDLLRSPPTEYRTIAKGLQMMPGVKNFSRTRKHRVDKWARANVDLRNNAGQTYYQIA